MAIKRAPKKNQRNVKKQNPAGARLGVVVLAPARSRFTHRTRALNFERPNHATSDAPPFVQHKTERGARAGVATVAGALTRCRAAREVPPS